MTEKCVFTKYKQDSYSRKYGSRSMPPRPLGPDQVRIVSKTGKKVEIPDEVRQQFIPWVEKYRPAKMEDISHQKEVVMALLQSIESSQIPHLLFYGPPGTGKTSTILALAKEIFGSTFYKQRILELNASDERGISIVREKIKQFAQRKISRNPDGHKNIPPLQIVILDEADSMTIDAQSALRRIIELYSLNTRFCIICNYLSKLIEPVASRCVKFRFSQISREAQIERLSYIAQKEQVPFSDSLVFEAILEISEGDLRRSINMLQTGSCFASPSEPLTQEIIRELAGVIPLTDVQKIDAVLQHEGQCGYSEIQDMCSEIIWEGFDVQQLLGQILDFYCNHERLSDVRKAKISEVIAQTDFIVIQGGDQELNLLYALSNVASIIRS